MVIEVDKVGDGEAFGRIVFEERDRDWLKATPALRALAQALLAFEMKLRKLGKVPAHFEGYVSRSGIFVECWRFEKNGIETPSFLGWKSPAAEPVKVESCAIS